MQNIVTDYSNASAVKHPTKSKVMKPKSSLSLEQLL